MLTFEKLESRQENILINGHQLYVEQHGDPHNATLFLLHHGLGSVHAWKEQVPTLVEAGYHVVAYDRWGYGRSDARENLSAPFFEEDRLDLLMLMDIMNIQTTVVVGHSDGGTIGLYFAMDHPQRVKGLVVVAAHIYVEPKMAGGIHQVKHSYHNDRRLRAGLERTHGSKTQAVFAMWYNAWMKPDVIFWDMRSELGKVSCKTLVVQGELDEHAIPRHAEDIARYIPHAELRLIPGANHMLPQEQSVIFNQLVLDFVSTFFM